MKLSNEFVNTGEKLFSCGFCDKRFRQLSNKKRHELLHTGEKPYSCQFCDKKFRVQSNMKVHEKRCKIKPNEKYFDINFMLHSATERKLENKSLKSEELNNEKSKITKIENEILVSDSFTGKKHSKKTERSKDLKDSPKDHMEDKKKSSMIQKIQNMIQKISRMIQKIPNMIQKVSRRFQKLSRMIQKVSRMTKSRIVFFVNNVESLSTLNPN